MLVWIIFAQHHILIIAMVDYSKAILDLIKSRTLECSLVRTSRGCLGVKKEQWVEQIDKLRIVKCKGAIVPGQCNFQKKWVFASGIMSVT